MKKVKPYIGDVPFEWSGNPSIYATSYVHYIKAGDFENGVLHYDEYDSKLRAVVKKPCQWTLDEIKFKPLATPTVRGSETYVAEANRVVMVPNFTFKDTLEFRDFNKGRSSMTFHFVSTTTGKVYHFFAKHFQEAVPLMEKGFLTGEFTFVKRSNYFGTKLA